jgi:DNA-binding NarL/FixJ family response regulator
MTQVLVIDDHPIVLEGCRQLLKFAGVKRIVQTQSLADGFRLYRSKKPDLIIVDLAMRTGALGGLSFIRRLRLHDTRTPILVFSMHNDPFIVSRALKIGANGYILKDTPSEEIMKAFEKVRDGAPYLSHELASAVAFMEARGKTTNPLRAITVRELQILSPYAQIATDLQRELQDHRQYLRAAEVEGVHSLPELMRMAIQYLPSMPGKSIKDD